MAAVTFLSDDFVAPTGTLLENYDSKWVKSTVPGGTGSAQVVGERVAQTDSSTTVYCHSDSLAPSPDYDVSAKHYFVTGAGSPSVGICGRMAGPGAAALTFYQARLVNNGSGLVVARFANGTSVTLGSTAVNYPAGAEPKVTLRMKGNQISMLIDDALVLGPFVDNNIAGPGYVGLRMASANANQIRIDELRATTIEDAAGVSASLSAALADATLISAGSVSVVGAAASVLNPVGLSASVELSSKASLAKSLAPAFLLSTAYIEAEPPQQDGVEGTLSKTLIGATLAASASLATRGVLASALDDAIVESTAAAPIAAALAQALEPVALAATATRPTSAHLEATLEDAALSASFRIYLLGTVRAPAGAGYAPQRAAISTRPAQTGGHRPPATQETTR
jgi:hypothetical protein